MRLLLSFTLSIMLALFTVGCGNNGSAFGRDAGESADGTVNDGNPFGFGDSAVADAGCVGLQCQQTCSATAISGTVYDPANLIGLYNVYVYVPNTNLDPITDGPVCTQCQAPASGNPVASATTDANGKFSIPNAPIGTNIPLVLQLGKWRRHLMVNTVTACVDNPQPDHTLRLPKKQHETSPDDNIPLMALTTGCDSAECFFLSRIGIDPSEFTAPTGSGRVHIYKSANDYGQVFAGGAGTATALWTTPGEMLKYDIVFDACECSTYDRGGAGSTNTGYKNFLAYLNAGGRAFTTHYYYNFFANPTQCPFDTTCDGQPPLPTVGAWEGNQGLPYATASNCPTTSFDYCLNIDTGIPKGKALADWYKVNDPSIGPVWGPDAYGFVGLTDIRNDMGSLSAPLVAAGTATPWLFAGDVTKNYDAYYFSFNTPVGTDPTTQCGRAIFSDVHLAPYPPLNGSFPGYCPSNPASSDHAPNQLVLEFLFFDLASCVQNDTQPPPPPH